MTTQKNEGPASERIEPSIARYGIDDPDASLSGTWVILPIRSGPALLLIS